MLRLKKLKQQEQPPAPPLEAAAPAQASPLSFPQIQTQLHRGKVDLKALLADYEASIITEALRQTKRLNAAAEKLSMSPQKLQYRMERLGLKENQKFLMK